MIYLDNQQVDVTIFPDKTSQVWKLNEETLNQLRDQATVGNKAIVKWEFESEGEFLHLAQLKDLLDSEGIRSELFVPTLPYARQDKHINNNSTFALRTFTKLLNSLKFDSVKTIDAHNIDLSYQLINNFTNLKPDGEVQKLAFDIADVICFPDQGAEKRYSGGFLPTCYGVKKRDLETGYIEGYEFSGNVAGKRVFIWDDLCDGGMTFIKCTEKLLQGGAKEVYLYVSHGIFSKGTKVLFDAGISRIFTKEGEVENS